MKKIFCVGIFLVLTLFVEKNIYEKFAFSESMPILAYHDVLESPINETDVSIKNFEKQMKYLSQHYHTLSMDQFYDWKNGEKIDGKNVLLTFDDGKESFYTIVVPILSKYNLKGTVFIIESAIGQEGYLTKEQISDLKEHHSNITLASHSYRLHEEEAATSNDYSIYNEDMKQNQENGYLYYAYPFGIQNESYIQALKDNQYRLSFLFSPSHWATIEDHDYKIPRVPIYKSNSLLKFKLKLFIRK